MASCDPNQRSVRSNGYLNVALDWAEHLSVVADMGVQMREVDGAALSDETKSRIATLLATLPQCCAPRGRFRGPAQAHVTVMSRAGRS